MYSLNLSRTKAAPAQGAEPARRAAHRDDLLLPDPALAPISEELAVAEEPTVQAVTTVEPQMKKFRATICRTVTQSAIVEYEALETQAQYSVAEDIAAQVPAEAWTTDPSNSWCYIDKLEDLGAAPAAADPVGPEEIAADDTLADPSDDGLDPDDETLPPSTSGRKRARRAPHARMEPDELISQAQAILDEASMALSSLTQDPNSGIDPNAVVASLEECMQQIRDLQANVDGDMSGGDADISDQTEAVQFVADVQQQIAEMLEEAQADANAAADLVAA